MSSTDAQVHSHRDADATVGCGGVVGPILASDSALLKDLDELLSHIQCALMALMAMKNDRWREYECLTEDMCS